MTKSNSYLYIKTGLLKFQFDLSVAIFSNQIIIICFYCDVRIAVATLTAHNKYGN